MALYATHSPYSLKTCICDAAFLQGASSSKSFIKSSEPVKSRPAVIASGGSGANHTSGVTSRDRGGTVLAGVGSGDGDDGGGVVVDNNCGTDVTLGVLAGRLQEDIAKMITRKSGWIFMVRLSS